MSLSSEEIERRRIMASRNKVLGLVLVAFVVLFFAITLVKLRAEAARGHSLISPATTGRPVPQPATPAKG